MIVFVITALDVVTSSETCDLEANALPLALPV